MDDDEKIEKSDYFANPKKDEKKRPGRPPGRKNNKTLEAEKMRKENEIKKTEVKKDEQRNVNELDTPSYQAFVNAEMAKSIQDVFEENSPGQIYFRNFDEFVQDQISVHDLLTKLTDNIYSMHYSASAEKSKTEKSKVKKDSQLDAVKKALEELDKWATACLQEMLQFEVNGPITIDYLISLINKANEKCDDKDAYSRWAGNTDDIYDLNKSVKFKGYNGTWQPLAKTGHYTIWKCNEEPNAYNVITKTMKNSKTGELVEKIVMEDVDEFKDAKVQKMFGVKNIEGRDKGIEVKNYNLDDKAVIKTGLKKSTFKDDIKSYFLDIVSACGGNNPINYKWNDDSVEISIKGGSSVPKTDFKDTIDNISASSEFEVTYFDENRQIANISRR